MSTAAPLPAEADDVPSEVSAADFLVWELLLKGRPPQPFTQADLDAVPESSGYRFELLDGILVVSPSPGLAHQRLLGQLYEVLTRDCPADCEVVLGPFDENPTPTGHSPPICSWRAGLTSGIGGFSGPRRC